jgi:hypothetical protein
VRTCVAVEQQHRYLVLMLTGRKYDEGNTIEYHACMCCVSYIAAIKNCFFAVAVIFFFFFFSACPAFSQLGVSTHLKRFLPRSSFPLLYSSTILAFAMSFAYLPHSNAARRVFVISVRREWLRWSWLVFKSAGSTMFARVTKTVTVGHVRLRRVHAVLPHLSSFVLAQPGVQQRGHSKATRPISSTSRASMDAPHRTADVDCFLSSSQPPDIASSSKDVINHSVTTVNGGQQKVGEVLRQLQQLASRRHHPTVNVSGTSSDSNADVNVLPDALADLMVRHDMVYTASTKPCRTNAALPAWEAGLQLVEGVATASSAAVVEWLLFLCLRRQDASVESSPPLEVCDGIYRAWRHGQIAAAEDAAAAKTQGRTASAQGTEQTDYHASVQPALSSPATARSPFAPKGIHHHYATWLLEELHATRRLLQAQRHVPMEGEQRGQRSSTVPTAAELDETAVVHHACFLLNRMLEVLLLDLPQDAAVDAISTETPAPVQRNGSQRHRRRRPYIPLRPTTALLVLEASRQLAQLNAEHRQRYGSDTAQQLNCTSAFPFLKFLSTPTPPVEGGRTRESVGGGEVIALSCVAQQAFEAVLRAAPSHPTTTAVGASLSFSSDALVLYLGFLMASSSSPSLTVKDLDDFVLSGSWTAGRLSRQHGGRVAATMDQEGATAVLPMQSHVTRAVAAAVGGLLSKYLNGDDAARAAKKHTALSDGRHADGRKMEAAFATLLLQPTPATLNALVDVQLIEDDAAQPPHNQRESERHHHHSTQVTRRREPVPWCVWVLQVLLYDLERAGQSATTAPSTELQDFAWHDSSHGSVDDTATTTAALSTDALEAGDVWQRQSDWTIAIMARLITHLRQHQPPRQPHHQKRSAALTVRWPFQEMWRLVFDAALRGCFAYCSLFSEAEATSHRREQRKGLASPVSTDVPPVLLHLCYPYYDKTQWRGPSVNLYVRLLHQWGQCEHILQVFTTVAGRERGFQAKVHAAVAARQASARVVEDDGEQHGPPVSPLSRSNHDDGADDDREGAKRARDVFQWYRPALSLHSCLITLKCCGCPPSVLAQLAAVGAYAGHSAINGDDDDAAALASRSSRSPSKAAADARLAGQVLQYMLCSLHIALANSPESPSNSSSSSSSEDVADEVEAHTTTTEGYPVEQWTAWVGSCCVPAVEQLYRNAGLENEWAALGY